MYWEPLGRYRNEQGRVALASEPGGSPLGAGGQRSRELLRPRTRRVRDPGSGAAPGSQGSGSVEGLQKDDKTRDRAIERRPKAASRRACAVRREEATTIRLGNESRSCRSPSSIAGAGWALFNSVLLLILSLQRPLSRLAPCSSHPLPSPLAPLTMRLFGRKSSKTAISPGGSQPNSSNGSLRSPGPTPNGSRPTSFPEVPLPKAPDPTLDPAGYLRSIYAVRERSRLVLEKAKKNQLKHFTVDMSKFGDVASFVVSIIKVPPPAPAQCAESARDPDPF